MFYLPGSDMSLDDLLAEAVGTRPRGRAQCWAKQLSGVAVDYVAALVEAEADEAGSVFRRRVADTLNGDTELGEKHGFSYDVTEDQVRSHVRGDCSCR